PLERRPQEPEAPRHDDPSDPRAALTKWAEVDHGAITDNVRALRRHVGEDVAVMAMVKANGYGHGMVETARAAIAGGATWLGVSSAEEAVALRGAGTHGRILVTGWAHPALGAGLVAADVDLTVLDGATLDAAIAAARAARRRARVHIKVDTGMGRLGARPDTVAALCRLIAASRDDVEITGVFTHFASAETDPEFTEEQNERLVRLAEMVRQLSPDAIVHAANSAAALARPHTWHDLVRPGIALYGYPPVDTPDLGLRLAMTVAARVTQVRTVAPGDTVGYGRTWRASRPTRVATVAAGYADAVPRALSNRGALLVRGHRCPVVGRVSMDQTAVDVGDIEVVPGDEAVVFGERGNARLDAADVAQVAGTIANDILCAVTARVPRVPAGRPSAG
ncbi:MAG TPA: alanine racemase, partial [Candidatus Dormibacteraeota bacterium]|nr:alanine racemase [Candidatus Dormibacteraeota bacterium]